MTRHTCDHGSEYGLHTCDCQDIGRSHTADQYDQAVMGYDKKWLSDPGIGVKRRLR